MMRERRTRGGWASGGSASGGSASGGTASGGTAVMRVRLALGGLGVALGLVGLYAFVTSVPPRQWLGVGTWLAGGVAAHDAVIAPAAVLLGLVVLRRFPPAAAPALRILLLAGFTVALIGIPLFVTRS